MIHQLISYQDETRAAIRCGCEVLDRLTQQNVDTARNVYLDALNGYSSQSLTSETNSLESAIHHHVQFALNGNKVAWDAICRFIWGEEFEGRTITELCQHARNLIEEKTCKQKQNQ
jgi:hypothetical protein